LRVIDLTNAPPRPTVRSVQYDISYEHASTNATCIVAVLSIVQVVLLSGCYLIQLPAMDV